MIEEGESSRLLCCAGPYFALERWQIKVPYEYTRKGVIILSNIGPPTGVRYKYGEEKLPEAQSVLLPAALGEIELLPGEYLAGYLPHLEADLKIPLI